MTSWKLKTNHKKWSIHTDGIERHWHRVTNDLLVQEERVHLEGQSADGSYLEHHVEKDLKAMDCDQLCHTRSEAKGDSMNMITVIADLVQLSSCTHWETETQEEENSPNSHTVLVTQQRLGPVLFSHHTMLSLFSFLSPLILTSLGKISPDTHTACLLRTAA